MKTRLLRIIAVVLVGVGLILTAQMLYYSYQLQLEYPPDLSKSEELSVAIIGATISISWYFPFFIVAFILFRKSRNNERSKEIGK